MLPLQKSFGALVILQAAHSVEEYVGRLWESFPPATFVTGLVSSDREIGFLVLNAALVAFGCWCFFWPVRKNWSAAPRFVWFWVAVEVINGIGHPLWSVRQRAYTPGLITAPLLLVVALIVAVNLRDRSPVEKENRWPGASAT